MIISPLDLIIVAAYLAVVLGFGGWFFRNQNTERYMVAGRSLPGWAVGLSIFGSYVSSISFLANPGKAYSGTWSAFSFAILMPVAAWIACKWFVPFYRATGDVSAYDHLDRRFGAWAKIYSVGCYLALQIARQGTIMYLLSGALQPFTGWSKPLLIGLLSLLVTIYPFLGGQEAVIWAGVFQSIVLLIGPLLCLLVILQGIPGGLSEFAAATAADDKFSLGSFVADFSVPTFWVIVLYGFVTHLQNFGIDQAYVQRYVSARSDRAAIRSVWLATAMFIPVSALFFLIGTGLYVYYRAHPELLPAGMGSDDVFPWFIRYALPVGFRGLVLSALCAAAMDSNLASMATLYWCDIHKPLFKTPEPRGVFVLRAATIAFALLSTVAALAMLDSKQVLDSWWTAAGICSGGMLGLFLLGRISRRADGRAAAAGVLAGTLVILWMTLLPMPKGDVATAAAGESALEAEAAPVAASWRVPNAFRSPFHENMILVLGTATVLGVGLLSTALRRPRVADVPQGSG
ncbi:MAG: sodium:solute symporter [Planctomyces sp.]|nr:sodium:solute symporter [Planctomyces sp.]